MLLCCFLVEFMKHRLLGGLTLAVMMSVAGVPQTSAAEDINENQTAHRTPTESFNSPELFTSNVSEISSAGSPSGSAATVSEQTRPGQQAFSNSFQSTSDLTEVYSHLLDDRQAATLFVNSIPVLTFVGVPLSTAGDAKALDSENSTSGMQDPAVRAEDVAQQLDSLSADLDASDIRVRWDEDQELFVIDWQDQDLVAFTPQTMLSGTTEDPAEDALQAANRLRRLLGAATPLTEIEGMPEPAEDIALVSSTYTGMASWYGPGFHGRQSASGEVFNQHALTAAHRTLPFGTRVRVTNVHTGQQVVVRINDRGPFSHGRIIDLSAGAAAEIGLRRMGVGRVRVEVLSGQ
jgi:rare lipoprotein A